MATQVTLAYKVNPTTRPSAALSTLVSEKSVPSEFTSMLGISVTSDTTVFNGTSVVRTIVFNVNTAAFRSNFTASANVTAPFKGLMTGIIQSTACSPVLEQPIVVV